MVRRLWENNKNIIIKVFCYLVIFSLLLVCFSFNIYELFRRESSLVSAQTNDELMELVTNDSYEIIGETTRTTPETFGVYSQEEYPSSLYTLTTTDQAKRESIYNENVAIYEDIELAISENRLKKHVSADGQFFGTVSDEAKAIVKKTYVNASVKRKHSLGVYAPAGEVLEVKISEDLINKGISVVVGYEVVDNNIPLARFLNGNQNRMPIMHKSFNLTSTTTKVGTPLGGAVYVHVPDGVSENFEITVSGGVDNPVFQLGINSEEEYKDMLETPGLMMEFKLPHIRLIMPKSYAYEGEVIPALKLWHKMSSLSTYAMNRVTNTLPIAHYYDSYIPAGAAVAFVWAWFSVLPLSWGTNSLNYEAMMQVGNWGDFHEFNHHYQSMNYSSGQWGLTSPGEVSNNVLTTMGYLLYTDIAATRNELNAPGGEGWNVSTDPYYNFKKVMETSSNVASFENFGTNQLFMYADLMHSFGIEKFMKLIRSSYGLEGYEKDLMSDVNSFAIRASKVLESDLTYYLVNICKMTLEEETITTIKNMNYDPYLPLHNLYSNGIKNLNTGRTYYLNSNTYTFDFKKYTLTPFEYEIKEVSSPKNGRLKKVSEGVYEYSNPYYRKDSFSITYKIKYNDKEYLKTLDFEIDFSFNEVNIKTYSTTDTDLDSAISNVSRENLLDERFVNSLNYNSLNGVNLSVAKGKLKVNKTGNYIFAIYGDDKIKFVLNGKEANTTTYTNKINLEDERTYFTTYLKEGELYDYTLYCLNGGGAGGAYVLHSFEDENDFKPLANSKVHSENATKDNMKTKLNDYEIKYDVTNSLKANKYSSLLVNQIESITTNANANADTVVENMFDGDKSTAFHTAWQSNITAFPHEYIIKFKETALFDCISMYFSKNSTYYAIGQYELYISDNGKDYELIKKDSNTKGFLTIDFDKQYKAKYLKIIVKSNVDNKLFTSINEIEVGIKSNFDNLNYYAGNNSKLFYIDEWNLSRTNNHFNGVVALAKKDSKLEFKFSGDELVIYTTLNSKYRIKVDNKKWVTVSSNSSETTPSYIIKGLANKEHKVVIEALNNETGIEMIGVSGELKDKNVYGESFVELYKIIGSIALSIAIIEGAIYIRKKQLISKGITKIKDKINEKL